MGKGTKRLVAGAIGGAIGGSLMALALLGTRRIAETRMQGTSDRIKHAVMAGTGKVQQAEENGELAKYMLVSAGFGALYGAFRSAVHISALLTGPLYGLATYGLSRAGLGPTIQETPGPWNDGSLGIVPRMVTHTVYGTVTDFVADRIESALS